MSGSQSRGGRRRPRDRLRVRTGRFCVEIADDPGLPIVLTTGYSEAAAGMNNAEFRLLLKPYSLEALGDVLSVEPR
jgi:hypothetical protein